MVFDPDHPIPLQEGHQYYVGCRDRPARILVQRLPPHAELCGNLRERPCPDLTPLTSSTNLR